VDQGYATLHPDFIDHPNINMPMAAIQQ